ncbi:MAG: AsmA family protein, partial [Candidatus Binatia bacterium]
MSRILRALGYTVAALALGVLVVVAFLAVNHQALTPWVIGAISKSTGRELQVNGDVRARLFSWRPRLMVRDVTFANPEWSKEEQMLEVGRFKVAVKIWPMLRGDLVVPVLRIEDATIRLEERADGENNWTIGAAAAPEDRTEVPTVRKLKLRDTRVLYSRQGKPQSATDLQIDEASGSITEKVTLEGKGRYQKNPARLKIEAGSISELHSMDTPFPLEAAIHAGSTTATMKGHLTGGLEDGGLDVRMTLKGDTLAELYPLLGVVLPESPPYSVTGKLGRNGSAWTFQDFAGKLGDSDLSGNLAVDVEPERPVMSLNFRSKLLDFDDLAGLIGAPPATGAGETASDPQKAASAMLTKEGRVLPNTPVDVPKLNAMDVYGRLIATRVNAPNHMPIDDLDLQLTLTNGTLRAQPARFDVASGRVELFATLHTDRKPLHADVVMNARGLDAARILGPTPFTNETSGRIDGDIKLAMQGESLRKMASTAYGTMKLLLSDAQVSKLLIELVGLDVMKSLGVMLSGDEPVRIHCGGFDLVAKNGQVTSNLAVLDTPNASIEAEVSLNLATEKLDVRVIPHPKDVSLLSLRQDLIIEGTLADLDYYPDPLKAGPVDGFRQKLNFVLAPIVGLLTPFDMDDDADEYTSGCNSFLREHGNVSRKQEPPGGNAEAVAGKK